MECFRWRKPFANRHIDGRLEKNYNCVHKSAQACQSSNNETHTHTQCDMWKTVFHSYFISRRGRDFCKLLITIVQQLHILQGVKMAIIILWISIQKESRRKTTILYRHASSATKNKAHKHTQHEIHNLPTGRWYFIPWNG